MATAEKRMKILKLVQDGKISPQDGVRLIESLAQPQEAEAPAPLPPVTKPGGAGRVFHVCVTDTRSGKMRINVRLPVTLLHAGMQMGLLYFHHFQLREKLPDRASHPAAQGDRRKRTAQAGSAQLDF